MKHDMKDVKPEKTPPGADVEKYSIESNSSKFLTWFSNQNWFYLGILFGILLALLKAFKNF